MRELIECAASLGVGRERGREKDRNNALLQRHARSTWLFEFSV